VRKELPHLRKLVRPALATFTKKTRVAADGIHIREVFNTVRVERAKLNAYREYFGFKEVLPLPYIYLLAQRAQGALMLHKSYTIPIPGTIHLENKLQAFKGLDPNTPFAIEASLDVKFEAMGSLNPIVLTRFYQHGEEVALCESAYLVKRKVSGTNKNSKRKRVAEVYEGATKPMSSWGLTRKITKEYAAISDDHNPIHKSTLAARLVGFKSPIAHGWYIVSRALAECGGFGHKINAQFKRPLFTPGQYSLYENSFSDGRITLEICDELEAVLARVQTS